MGIDNDRAPRLPHHLDELDPDSPMEVRTGVGFGHLDSLIVLEGERAELMLRSGKPPRFRAHGGYTGKLLAQGRG